MKKIILATFVAFVAFSCSKNEQATINGTVQNMNNGIAYFSIYDGENGYRFDYLAQVKDEKFVIKKESLEPVLYEFKLDSTAKFGTPFFIESGEVTLTGTLDSLRFIRRGGTPNNMLLQAYFDMEQAYNAELKTVKDKHLSNYKLEMQTAKGQNILSEMRAELNATRTSYERKLEDWIVANRKSVAPLYVIEKYLKHKRDKKWLTLLFDQMDAEVKRTTYGRKLGELIKQYSQLSTGDYAPNFTGLTPEGETKSLFENLGQPLTLVDFWASWCAPCRKANPELVRLHRDYKDKGFQIIGYSLDKPGQEAKWKEAILVDQLNWLQVSNLKEFDDPAVKAFQIDAIPTTFLLDARGQIVARNLFGAELRDFVDNYFQEGATQNQPLTK